MHSINVYNAMMQHFFTEGEDNPETFAVCALLHDVCKANFYKVSTRNVKMMLPVNGRKFLLSGSRPAALWPR